MINSGGDMERAVAARQAQVGGDWFFWIAGLSVVNTLLGVLHVPLGFFFGLGVTDYAALSGITTWLAVTVVASAFFASFGLFARKGQQWAFIVGALFYLLDAAIVLLLTKQYLEAAAHAYVLFRLFQGFQGAQRLAALRAQQDVYRQPGETPGVWPPPPSG